MITIQGPDDAAPYPIDCALEERLTYESDVTENEVERGAPTTDHIRPKLPVLEFDGVVSDTPIGLIALDPSRNTPAGSPSPSRDAFNRFVAIHDNAVRVTIVCTFGKFEDMAMTSCTPVRDSKSLKAFKFTASFKKIRIVDNTRTIVRAATPMGGGGAKLGAREALLKFLDKNVVWVVSRLREPTYGNTYFTGDTPTVVQDSPHKPVKDHQYGTPILSTTHGDRVRTNGAGGDRFGFFWVDHYRLATADNETNQVALTADGYVVLHNVNRQNFGAGVASQEVTTKKAEAGYYFLNGTYPGSTSATDIGPQVGPDNTPSLSPNAGKSQFAPSPVGQNPGSNSVTDGNGNQLTKRPPGPDGWPSFLGNNGS